MTNGQLPVEEQDGRVLAEITAENGGSLLLHNFTDSSGNVQTVDGGPKIRLVSRVPVEPTPTHPTSQDVAGSGSAQ